MGMFTGGLKEIHSENNQKKLPPKQLLVRQQHFATIVSPCDNENLKYVTFELEIGFIDPINRVTKDDSINTGASQSAPCAVLQSSRRTSVPAPPLAKPHAADSASP